MVKKIFLLACLFSLLFTVPAMAASSKAKLLTDTSSSANTVPFINAGPAEDSTAATGLGVQVNGTEMMRVTATGNVGIGTTSPAVLLDLKGSNTAWGGMIRLQSNDAANVNFYNSTASSLSASNLKGTLSYDMSANEMVLGNYNGGTGGIFLLNPYGGNVGIGTTSPSAKLDVYSSGRSINAASSGEWGGVFYGVNGVYGNSPSSYGVQGNNSGSGCFGFLGSPGYSAGGNCTTSFSSDARLKKEITPVQSGLDVVMKLRPVSYFWKMDGKNHDLTTDKKKKALNYGFIAQDVMKVLPDLVTETPAESEVPTQPGETPKKAEKKETMYGLDYNGFIAPTVAAVQELNGKVEKLKAENDNLRTSDKELRTRLEKLEARVK